MGAFLKIDELHIKNFGKFHDFNLPLGQNRFTIIFGENEAGKSTLTHFFKHLVFGMPAENKYRYYLSGKQKGGFGHGKLDNGISFKLESYKRKQKSQPRISTIDAAEQCLAEQTFTDIIKMTGDQVYKNLFACTAADFHNTSEFLKQKDFKAFLSQFLIGGHNPKVILESLNLKAEEYFNSIKGKRKLKKLKENIVNLKTQVSEKELKSSDYYSKKRAFETADKKCHCISEKIQTKRQSINLQLLMEEWFKENERREDTQLKIAGLNPPRYFPPAGITRMEEHRQTIEQKKLLKDKLSNELDHVKLKINELVCKQSIISQADKVKFLELNSKEAIRLTRTIPEMNTQAGDLNQKLINQLRDLDPTWEADDLDQVQISAVELAKLDKLGSSYEKLSHIAADLEAAKIEITGKKQFLKQQKKRYQSALVPKQDLQEMEGFFNNQVIGLISKREELEETCKLISTNTQAMFRELSYESTNFQSIDELISQKIPDLSQIEQFADKFAHVIAIKQDLQDDISQDKVKKSKVQSTIIQLKSKAGITGISLSELREKREYGWKLLKAKISRLRNGDLTLPSEEQTFTKSYPNLESAIEALHEQIDNFTDKIVENHELVSMEKQEQELEFAIAEKSLKLKVIFQEEGNLTADWEKIWSGLPMSPMDPHLMLDWRKLLSSLRAEHARYQNALAERKEITRCLESFLTMAKKYISIDQGRASLKEAFRAFFSEQNRIHTLLEKLGQDYIELESLLAGKQQEALMRMRQREELESEWTSHLLKHFPDKKISLAIQDWPTFANSLANTKAIREELKQLKQKIKEGEKELKHFTLVLKELCDCFEVSWHSNAIQISLEHVLEVFEMNAAAKRKIDELLIEQKHLLDSLKLQNSELAATNKQIAELLEASNCMDQQEFFKAGNAYQQASPLVELVERLEHNLDIISRKIEKIGIPGYDVAKLENAPLDIKDIEQNLLREQTELLNLENELKLAYEDLAAKKLLFEKLDGSEDVAYFHSEISGKESEFKEGLNDYLSLKLGATIFSRVLESFETQTHPEFIKLASAYLSEITCAKYTEISEEDDEYYIERSDGAPLAINELSTGTLDQLYLSIRLAAMDQLASKGETLPFILDDILANSDYKRCSRALRAISRLSQKTQIIYLTCHPNFMTTAKACLNYNSYSLVHLS